MVLAITCVAFFIRQYKILVNIFLYQHFVNTLKKRKSERNVVLSTLTEYVLARMPEAEAKTLVKQAYGNRYKDANKLLKTVAELRTLIISRTNEVGLFMQFINEIGRKYAW